MDVRIRSYRDGQDRAAVVDLWRECELLRPWNDPGQDIDRKLRVHPHLFLVAEADGRLVGSVMAGYEGHRGWLNYLAVSADYRRQGIGRRLVAEAERLLLAMGCPKLNLQIRTDNPAVVDFYRKLGYQQDPLISYSKRLLVD